MIKIMSRMVGDGAPPYVVAELSGNHNGDINRAFQLIEVAKKSGADAVKLQTYTADSLTIQCDKSDFKIKEGPWAGWNLYDLYAAAHTPWEWHEALFAKGKEIGITVFSSPFDEAAVDLLESLGAPAYKIASFEIVDHMLIEKAASTGKPIILSTGMASKEEIAEALEVVRSTGNDQIILLHCVSAYPTLPRESNLKTIPDLAKHFDVCVGLSDHTLGISTAITSVALGAVFIEKHVTLARAMGGPDAAFSLEPDELAQLCKEARVSWESLGIAGYSLKPSELASTVFRRSLYVVEDVVAGQQLTRKNVRSIRPGYGLAPKLLKQVLGKKAVQDISRGTPLTKELFV